MDGEPSSKQKQNYRSDKQIVRFIVAISKAVAAIGEPQSKHDNDPPEDDRQAANDAALVRHASRTASATIVIAVASLLTFGAAILQYLVFNAQLGEMRGGAADTHALADAAVKSAQAANDQLIAIRDQLGLMKAASDVTAKQLRAYLVTDAGNLMDWANPNMRTVLDIKNAGQTPAYDVSSVGLAMIVDYPFKGGQAPVSLGTAPLLREVLGARNRFVVLGPGEVLQLSVLPNEAFTQEDIQDVVINKKKAYVVIGSIYYTDAFGINHFTHFCKLATGNSPIINRSTDSLHLVSVCAEGNDSD